MSLQVLLPSTLSNEVCLVSNREGLSVQEHVALMLGVSTTLLKEEKGSPLRLALDHFFAQHAIDADQMASALLELTRRASALHDQGKSNEGLQAVTQESNSSDSALESILARTMRGTSQVAFKPRVSALGKYAHLAGGSEEYAREKQQDIAREEEKFR